MFYCKHILLSHFNFFMQYVSSQPLQLQYYMLNSTVQYTTKLQHQFFGNVTRLIKYQPRKMLSSQVCHQCLQCSAYLPLCYCSHLIFHRSASYICYYTSGIGSCGRVGGGGVGHGPSTFKPSHLLAPHPHFLA